MEEHRFWLSNTTSTLLNPRTGSSTLGRKAGNAAAALSLRERRNRSRATRVRTREHFSPAYSTIKTRGTTQAHRNGARAARPNDASRVKLRGELFSGRNVSRDDRLDRSTPRRAVALPISSKSRSQIPFRAQGRFSRAVAPTGQAVDRQK